MRRQGFINKMQRVGFTESEAVGYADQIVSMGGRVSYEGFYNTTVLEMTRLGVSVFRHYRDTNSSTNENQRSI